MLRPTLKLCFKLSQALINNNKYCISTRLGKKNIFGDSWIGGFEVFRLHISGNLLFIGNQISLFDPPMKTKQINNTCTFTVKPQNWKKINLCTCIWICSFYSDWNWNFENRLFLMIFRILMGPFFNEEKKLERKLKKAYGWNIFFKSWKKTPKN